MGLKLEKGLRHQTEAINRINKVFENVNIINNTTKYANPIIDLSSESLIQNIKNLNKDIPSSMRGKTGIENYLNIDVKMETGTGKTYVYTKMIYELNKNYGIHKFIILVPSLPIKIGTTKFIESGETINHFKDQYGKSIDLCVLNAKKSNSKKDIFPSAVRNFVEQSELLKDRITVLIANMHLFTDGRGSMLTKSYSSVVEDFDVPCDAIAATKPFLIIDEPHRIAKNNKTFQFVEQKIKPQCIFRFGATFPEIREGRSTYTDYMNLIYNLGSCEAFNDNLVKGVSVKYITSPDGNNKRVKLLSIENREKAKFELITERGRRSIDLEKNDSLKRIDDSFENIIIDGIGKTVFLSNGQELSVGNEIYTDIYSTSYQSIMIQNALDSHFKAEKENFKRRDKIKTLALFFIDDIDSYRPNPDNPIPTYLKDIFEKLLKDKINRELSNIDLDDENEVLYKEYLEATLDDISSCHGGYFARDNSSSDDAIAEEVEKILVKKEETLSIYKTNGKFNTFRFIFSKWTLKEGWDNPNVFTICKLRSSGSEISKLQEVGRGLRLPVNEMMSRISNEQFYLNYIVDFTEKDFANKLVSEINGDFVENTKLSTSIIEDLATKLGKTTNETFIELLTKGYIDMDKNIILEKREELFNDYPDLTIGLKSRKVIDENNSIELPKAKINKEKYKEIKDVLQNKWAGFSQHVAAIIHNSVDVAVLTFFSNPLEVSVYSVYMLVINSIKDLAVSLSGGIDSWFGNLLAKGDNKTLNENLKLYEFFYFSIVAILFACTMSLELPFVKVYTAGITDADYIRPSFAYIMIFAELVMAIRIPYNSIVLSAGHFKQTQFGAWIEAGLNVSISCILVKKYGIVGVAVGTLIAMLYRTTEYIIYSSKNILKRSAAEAFRKALIVFIEIGIVFALSRILPFNYETTYLNFLINAIFIGIISVVVVVLGGFIVYKNEMKQFIFFIKRRVKKHE